MTTSLGVSSSSFLRDRVHQFETEMQKVIDDMIETEKAVASLNNGRRGWLESVSGADDIDRATFLKRLEGFRQLASVEQIAVESDSIRLDEVYEQQQLHMLIEATKPFEDDETDEERERKLAAIALEGTRDMKESLEKSVESRRKGAQDTSDMLRRVEYVKTEYEQKGTMREDEVKERIVAYLKRLEESTKEAKAKFQRLTKDYLVLRHNCKVAKEILQRSKNAAHKERELLQQSLDDVNEQTKVHLERQEHACEEERKKLTATLRQTVLKKEREMEILRQITYAKKIEKKDATRKYKKAIKEYSEKYDELQIKRRREVRHITETLQQLRSRVHLFERTALETSSRTRILGGAGPAEGHAAFSGGGTFKENRALLSLNERGKYTGSEIDENQMGNLPPPPPGYGGGTDMTYALNTDALSRDERDLAMLTVRLKQLNQIARSMPSK